MTASAARTRRPLAAVLVLAVVFALFALASPAGASPETDESGFLRLINQDRTRAGLPALVSDTALAGTSRWWSGQMAAKGSISHEPNLGSIAASVEPAWRSIGENVGVGYAVDSLHAAFMASPGHRANIMASKYNRVGIGVVHANGRTWVTVRFLEGPTISGTTGLELPPLPETPIRGIEHACPQGSTIASFVDIAGNTHAESIKCVVLWQVASGKTATTYEPGSPITRQQLATFVRNMLDEAGVELPVNPPDHFRDDNDSVHHMAINQIAQLGVVNGKSPGIYQPAAHVSRAEMATVLVRAHGVITGKTLADGVNRFRDDDGLVHEVNINRVATAGIAAGNTSSTFAPKTRVTRAQMATFVSRTLDLLVDTGAVAPR